MIMVRFAGYGGQGLLTAGLILADAAALYDKKKVIQTQSYGPEARGGASKSDVIISDQAIAFPKPDKVDILVAMNQIAVDRHTNALKEQGMLLADATFVKTVVFSNSYLIPFTAIAREQFQKELVANVVALGALVELSGVVSKEAIEKALENRVPRDALDVNKRALATGYDMGKEGAAKHAQAERDFDVV